MSLPSAPPGPIDIYLIKVHQNIGDLYVGSMNARDLFEIATTDRLRLESLRIPKYAGFQRALDEVRVAEIRDYLNTRRSTLPNAIILSVDSDDIEAWDVTEHGISRMLLRRAADVATIIDGQHRVAALDVASDDFGVAVSIFVDLALRRKAEIFATINSTQRAVNPSIAFQLYGYAVDRSPRKTAHEIAETLNTTQGSPFFRRLRMVGSRDDWTAGTLSQATFAKGLLRLYSRKPFEDENRLLRGEELEDAPSYPLRAYFLRGEDRRILEVVWKFFLHVAETWPDQWTNDEDRSILLKTTGYLALIEVVRKWLQGPRRDQVLEDRGVTEAFAEIAERYTAPNRRFIRQNYPAGMSGVQMLRDDLLLHLGLGEGANHV